MRKMIMNKKTSISLLITLTVLIYAGCSGDFLNIEPKSSLTANSFYETAADAQSAINSAYASLQTSSMYSENYPKLIQSGTNDVILNNTTDLSLDSWSFAADLGPIDPVWQACYEGIFRSNLVMQEVPDIDMDEALKTRIIGEAYFLRALYYWHLSTVFGEIPVMTEADPQNISKAMVSKSPVSEVYDLMIGDLEQAINRLPTRSEYSDVNIGRATKGAAQALLGKIYLYNENYPMAEAYLDSVVASDEYRLIDNFNNLWVTDNNAESIFEVQYQNVGGSAWASTDAANNNEGNLRAILNYPNGHGGFGNILPTQNIVDEFEDHDGPSAIDGRDPRLSYSIFRDGDEYDQVEPVFNSDWSPTGFAMKKGMFPVLRDVDASSRNIVLIRLADVLLMYAEAANENGKPAEAIAAINTVRERVGMPPLPTAEYPVNNQQEIFEAIVHERRVELAFEYHRLNDLRRWGLAEEILGPDGYQAPKHRYFPIPQQELNANPELEQNSNY